jgi:hypothetical protein
LSIWGGEAHLGAVAMAQQQPQSFAISVTRRTSLSKRSQSGWQAHWAQRSRWQQDCIGTRCPRKGS